MLFIGFKRWIALVICVGLLGTVAGSNQVRAFFKSEMPAAQDVIGLDRRISLIEQRFYSLESRLNRVEQQVVGSQRVPPTTSQPRPNEINLLINEVELLRRRVVELECSVVRLDERTGESKEESKSTDPCRMKPQEPVRLSARPLNGN